MPVGMMSSALKPNEANATKAFNSISKPIGGSNYVAKSVTKADGTYQDSGLIANGAGSASMNYLQKSNYDAEISEIDVEF